MKKAKKVKKASKTKVDHCYNNSLGLTAIAQTLEKHTESLAGLADSHAESVNRIIGANERVAAVLERLSALEAREAYDMSSDDSCCGQGCHDEEPTQKTLLVPTLPKTAKELFELIKTNRLAKAVVALDLVLWTSLAVLAVRAMM